MLSKDLKNMKWIQLSVHTPALLPPPPPPPLALVCCSLWFPKTADTLTMDGWWNSAFEFIQMSAFVLAILTPSLTCLMNALGKVFKQIILKYFKHILIYHAPWSIIKMLIKKILKIERRRRNFLQILENREEKEKLVSNREENFFQVLKIERRKRNFSSDSWKSRGEWDMEISFSQAREKNLGHFSSRISRDRDSCQCLVRGSRFKNQEGKMTLIGHNMYGIYGLRPRISLLAQII